MFSRFQNHTQLDILSKKYEIFVIYEKTNYPLWKVNVKIIHSSLEVISFNITVYLKYENLIT